MGTERESFMAQHVKEFVCNFVYEFLNLKMADYFGRGSFMITP